MLGYFAFSQRPTAGVYVPTKYLCSTIVTGVILSVPPLEALVLEGAEIVGVLACYRLHNNVKFSGLGVVKSAQPPMEGAGFSRPDRSNLRLGLS